MNTPILHHVVWECNELRVTKAFQFKGWSCWGSALPYKHRGVLALRSYVRVRQDFRAS
jgi:hypothetical protein